MSKEHSRELYSIAEGQNGFFTAKQALSSGYSDRMQSYHVANGDWIREARGIFRLTSYPPSPVSEIMVWYLWSCNRGGEPQGIISHATALELYSLSSWSSQKIHMTVPPGFRRMAVPEVLQLHRKQLDKPDTMIRDGVRVTTPLRTIVDVLVDEQVPVKYIEEALSEALARKLILAGDISGAKLNQVEHERLEELLRKAA